MKKLFFIVLLVIAGAISSAYAQDGFKPIVNPPTAKDLVETLRTSGNYKTLIIVIGKVGLGNLGLKKNSKEQITLFAPNDAAFAKIPKQQFEKLIKDPAKLKNLLLAHIVKGRFPIAELLVPVGDGTSKTYTELKSLQGRVLGFQCNGHTGEHHPRVNGGKATVGKGDILFDSGVIHELDAVLMTDDSF
jgi:uncharacterized surface protein with fasciclin (FAS1) repeats